MQPNLQISFSCRVPMDVSYYDALCNEMTVYDFREEFYTISY